MNPYFCPSSLGLLFLHSMICVHSAELAMSSHHIAWEAILDFRRKQNTKLGLL